MDAYLTAVGFEDALIAELGRGRPLTPGVVIDERGAPLAESDHVFARQVLPSAQRIEGESIAKLADAAAFALVPILDASAESWRLDAFTPDDAADAKVLDRRASLVGEQIVSALGERRRRVLKRKAPDARWAVQLLLFDREAALLSAAPPATLAGGAPWPAPFVAGRAPVADDWDAPSSAFRKLVEAQAWLGASIGPNDRAVDLGAAPGGWTHVALAAGAEVTAVDKAEMDPRLARNRRLRHVKKDAFAYAPEGPVDWLLSDIIAPPEKGMELVERWTRERWCRRFVVHLKFKGDQQYGLVREALARVRANGYPSARAKKLFHDKNEVTLFGTLA